MSLKPRLLSLFALLGFVSCTSVEVDPLPPGLDRVLVVENEKVIVPDFLEFLRESFEEHGVATDVIRMASDGIGHPTLTYTALRSWDVTTYLSEAEIVVKHRGEQIGYAKYSLVGKGGLDFSKFSSMESKMEPVYRELLQNYPREAAATADEK